MYGGQKEWEGNKNEIIFSKNQRLNDFIFASEFLKDAKDMRMLEETGKISNERNMEALTDEEAPPLVLPPDEEEKNK
jgi:phospholipid/cholesterol/gamma-HCH transport system ATP-binding protein